MHALPIIGEITVGASGEPRGAPLHVDDAVLAACRIRVETIRGDVLDDLRGRRPLGELLNRGVAALTIERGLRGDGTAIGGAAVDVVHRDRAADARSARAADFARGGVHSDDRIGSESARRREQHQARDRCARDQRCSHPASIGEIQTTLRLRSSIRRSPSKIRFSWLASIVCSAG